VFKKFMVLALALASVAVACTPDQLRSAERHLGIDLTPEEEATFEALPDAPINLGRTTIDVDGTVTVSPCEEPAAPEAHMIMAVEPVRQTYAAVACARGWEPARILAWWEFVEDVVMKESMGCFNLRRDPVFRSGTGWGDSCVDSLVRNRNNEDSGYGQVTRSGWGPRGVVCRTTGLCSPEQIIASPFNSMTALVALVERSGSFPWCWNARARRFHDCSLAPDR